MSNGVSNAGWWSQRGWSRAGAIAVLLERPRTARALAYSVRLAIHLGACAVIALAVAVMLWNGIGPGPLDVFIGGVREITGLPLSLALYATVGLLLAIAWLLGRRPGIGNLITPLVMGPLMQIFIELFDRVTPPPGYVLAVLVQLLAVVLIGLGAGAMIVANIGAGTAELLSAATSDQIGQSVPRIRFALEASWLLLGALLGGPVGVGTVIVAITIGTAVEHGYRVVDAAVGGVVRSARRLVAATA